MDLSVRPQPIVGEMLPGFTAAAIFLAAYAFHDKAVSVQAERYASVGSILAGGLAVLFLFSWALGTVFDATRDIFEWLLDRYWFPLNWELLKDGDTAQIERLHDGWLAYYYLTGNYVVALSVVLLFSTIYRSVMPLSIDVATVIVCVVVIFVVNAGLMRVELRSLMRTQGAGGRPHDGVFTRLGVSPIEGAGVGVIAIRDIPSGADVFGADDTETVFVSRDETLTLVPEFRKLYHDFCPLRNGQYECPANFNSLTVSWYLNESDNPNVAPDADLRFKAIKPIKAGDELLAKYGPYSQNESADPELGRHDK